MKRVLAGLGVVLMGVACGSDDDSDGIADACRTVAELSCASDTEAECVEELGEDRVQAREVGCLREFDAFIGCINDNEPICVPDPDDGGEEVALPAECEPVDDVYEACITGNAEPVCSALPAQPSEASPCQTDCDVYAAACTGDGQGPFTCTCTAGPNVGASFSIAVCGDLLSSIGPVCGE